MLLGIVSWSWNSCGLSKSILSFRFSCFSKIFISSESDLKTNNSNESSLIIVNLTKVYDLIIFVSVVSFCNV